MIATRVEAVCQLANAKQPGRAIVFRTYIPCHLVNPVARSRQICIYWVVGALLKPVVVAEERVR
jgi:hypothetical protein